MHQHPAVTEAATAFERGDLARARALVEERLGANDESPLLHHLAGLIACRMGYGAQGMEWLRRAFLAEPQNPSFRLILSQALIDSGQPTEALEIASLSIEAQPSSLEILAVRAEAAFKANRRDLESEAWAAFCEMRPNEPLALINLARSLLAQNRFGEAESAYRQALTLVPSHAPAIFELSLTLERTNQIDALESLLHEALKRGVAKSVLAEPWALLQLRLGRPDLADEILRTPPTNADPVRWNRLRVRTFDALGDASSAFAAAVAMNRAVPDADHAKALATQYRAEIAELARTVTTEWAAKLPRLEAAPELQLAFLIGFPRSGTTLADTFLMGHPRCRIIEELPILNAAAAPLGAITGLDMVDLPALEHVRRDYLGQVQRVAEMLPTDVIIDKFPLNLLAAPLIHCLFPDAPLLFVQRHPCDVVLSGFMQSFEPNLGMASFLDLKAAAEFYDVVMKAWFAIRAALPLKVQTLVYEELVSDPERVLRPAVRALGLEWDNRVLDHEATAKKRATLLNTSYNQVTERLGASPSGRWLRYQEQLQEVLPILIPWARRLGYDN
ncbi:MAG TPA: sulfotransferase [Sphingomicrobium sp.]|nr:sulfotransferase [Sphingomicrobium sp.]